jgi:hypothetical protein
LSDDGYVEWEESQDMAELQALFCEQESDLFGEWLNERYASQEETMADMKFDQMRDEKAEASFNDSKNGGK